MDHTVLFDFAQNLSIQVLLCCDVLRQLLQWVVTHEVALCLLLSWISLAITRLIGRYQMHCASCNKVMASLISHRKHVPRRAICNTVWLESGKMLVLSSLNRSEKSAINNLKFFFWIPASQNQICRRNWRIIRNCNWLSNARSIWKTIFPWIRL
jgi:hypothetical protein